jgi:hypothetical protein
MDTSFATFIFFEVSIINTNFPPFREALCVGRIQLC